jgi:hypothetical protein
MNIGNAIVKYIREAEVSGMEDRIALKTALLGTMVGRYRLVRDSDRVVREMIRDRVAGILLLERTGRVFLPILRALYRKHGVAFPLWRSFDPGPNPFGHPLDRSRELKRIQAAFEGIGNVGVFDEYMVSGIRIKNTVTHLAKSLGRPVRGYVLQHKKGAENPEVEMEIFSAGHEHEADYVEIRNEMTERIFLPDEPMRFRNGRVSIPAYRRLVKTIVREVGGFEGED